MKVDPRNIWGGHCFFLELIFRVWLWAIFELGTCQLNQAQFKETSQIDVSLKYLDFQKKLSLDSLRQSGFDFFSIQFCVWFTSCVTKCFEALIPWDCSDLEILRHLFLPCRDSSYKSWFYQIIWCCKFLNRSVFYSYFEFPAISSNFKYLIFH